MYFWEGNIEKDFVIEPGKNLDEIVADLKREDIIPNSLLFKIAVKLTAKENQIISNTYLLKNGMSNLDLLRMLTDKSLVRLIKLTIPEGYTIKQIGNLIEKKLSCSKEIFYKETASDSLISLLGLKGKIKTLEGFLYPDTYEVSPNISEKKLVRLLFSEFRKKVLSDNKIKSYLNQNDSLLLNLITFASIIQGETGILDEMPVISGVYVNRLNKNMRLEADPTIQYIIPDGPRRLLFEDLKINSPYNTYKNKGLPPGPVNNPGINAVLAALNPEEHEFLFFVATGNGGHRFSKNYEEHLQAVKEYKLNLKKNKKIK